MRSLVCLLVMALAAVAQEAEKPSFVVGQVVIDKTGEVLPDATVRVAGTAATAVPVDAAGRFRLAVSPGQAVRLTVERDGFTVVTVDSPLVPAGEVREMTIRMNLLTAREMVTVTGDPITLRSDAPEISQVVTTRQLTELPANGRSLNRFALLNPHVRNTAGLGSDGSSAARLSINANSFRHTNYALDGSSNFDNVFANAPQQSLSLSAVQELKVLTNQYAAQYGGSTAGLLVAATKSGTDQFHGEALAFVRPSGLAAAPPVSQFRVPNERQQDGGSLGGPVVRGKTFLFGNYERVDQDRGSYLQSPTPSVFVGKLSEWFALARLDHQWNERHAINVRLNGNRSENNNANDRVGAFTQPSAAQLSVSQSVGAQIQQRSIWRGVVNEARFAYTNYVPSASSALFPQVSVVRPNYSTEGGSSFSYVRAQNYQFADGVAAVWGRHQIRAGAEYGRQFVSDLSYSLFGEYRFAPGAPQPGQQPLQYTQSFGTADLRYGQTQVAAYVQDDWKLHRRLTANLGLRYEWQSLTRESQNWAPRLGFAWDVTGSGNTTVRGGAGVFYDQYYFYLTRRFYSAGLTSPTAPYTLPIGTAGFPQFPASLSTAPTGLNSDRRDLYLPGSRLLNPYSLQYSLGVQQKLGDDWTFSFDAIHAHTLRQMRPEDMNAPAPFVRTGPGQRRTSAQADLTRPFQQISGVPVRNTIRVENSGSSLYDALDFGLLRRFAKRFQWEAHYVLSSANNYSMFFGEPNTGVPNDWGNTGTAERGPSDYHQRHRFVTNALVELPWRTQLSSVVTLASGLPVNPLTGVDNNGDTNLLDRPAGLGRNSFRAPSQQTVDLSLAKRMRLWERATVEVRAEAFNLFNRNNYLRVNGTYGDGAAPLSTFLQPLAGIQNVDPSRQVQFALRVYF